MQCKYYQVILGRTCECSLWRGGRYIEVVFKTGSTFKKGYFYKDSDALLVCMVLNSSNLAAGDIRSSTNVLAQSFLKFCCDFIYH